ncbi:hypothetical protein GLU01_01785 [Nanohaloarchaea archaeon]|nr:hypothetical protein [Candidatus Nanohaloarchaea archaeon]
MTSEESAQRRQQIQELLENADSPEGLYKLFETAGYSGSTRDPSYTRKLSEFDFKDKANNRISEIFTVLEYQSEITVLLIETESLSNSHIRYVSERLARKFNHVLPIFTSEYRNYRFVLPTFDERTPGDLDIQLTTLKVDSDNVFYSDADALSRIWIEEERRYPHIWNQWRDAFSIDKVTEQFFEDYQDQFFKIREQVLKQIDDVHDAHEFTLQFMNRMMFVYFVDKKGWLEGEEGESYIQWLWNIYRKQGGLQQDEENRFYSEYLTTLFHKSFNNKFLGNENLPEQISRSYSRAPYLNGGLFRENELTELGIELGDELIGDVIEGFFERYNFTIKEDSPVEKQVAVDPQMIGYVYESLSNVAEELEDLDKDSRKEFGIFYTPKEEVYFMVRRSLVEYLDNNTDILKDKIYRLVFAEGDEEEEEVRKELTAEELEEVKYTLQDMKSVDPACGSGAFLVGIIDVVSEIFKQVEKKRGSNLNMFEAKKQIIQNSIYGVDVKNWAINASELRLFLQLLIETDVPKGEIQRKALLPNLRANLRVGDSLVQDIDGIFFDLRENQLEGLTKSHMEEIQKEKSKFFEDRSKSKYNGIADIQTDEIKFFRRAIDDKIEELEEKLEEDDSKQQKLNGETKKPSGNEKRQITRRKKQTKKRIEKLEELKDDIAQEQDKMPMLWEVAFAEVFNNNGGFDVLIGNPPYVEHESISPPNKDPESVTKQDKSDYKQKLADSVKTRLPQVQKIAGKSNFYIYFYFHGLSLINDEGTFCFITQNSWLDAKYGRELQEFLCKYVPIHGIYQNRAKRAFEHADVNTVISIFGAPNFQTKSFGDWEIQENTWPETDNIAEFVDFKKPYREIISADILADLDSDQESFTSEEVELSRTKFEVHKSEGLRSTKIKQEELLEDSWEYGENRDGKFSSGKYTANKWGGKFLRAPDIFFEVMAKSGESLIELNNEYDIDSYLNTGGADKFYFVESKDEQGDTEIVENQEYEEDFEVESKYLKPLIKSPTSLEHIKVSEEDSEKLKILVVPPSEFEETDKVSEYIEFGEEKEYNERSGPSRRTPWWQPPKRAEETAEILLPRNFHDRHTLYYNPDGFVSNRFYRIYEKNNPARLAASLNSTLSSLCMELFGSNDLGQGALGMNKPDYKRILMIDPRELEKPSEDLFDRETHSIFEEIGLERNKPIREQEPSPLPDRKELDDIVFDALGLSEGERKEVYWSVAELVKARLDKAESV